MLMIKRFLNQKIVIEVPGGADILIIVGGIQGNKVQIGIEAPREFNIYRPERGKRPHAKKVG